MKKDALSKLLPIIVTIDYRLDGQEAIPQRGKVLEEIH